MRVCGGQDNWNFTATRPLQVHKVKIVTFLHFPNSPAPQRASSREPP